MKHKVEFAFKFLITLVSLLGLILNFKLLTVGGALIYYTIQSNLLCFLVYFVIMILYIFKKFEKNNIYYIMKGMATMAMAITMVVFQLFLSNTPTYQNHEIISMVVHLFVPLLAILDYIIFDEKGHLKKSYPFMWTATLIFYLVFDIIYVSLGGKYNNNCNYPYFFLSIDKFGYMGVAINCIIIYILFLLFGLCIQIIDQRINTLMKK